MSRQTNARAALPVEAAPIDQTGPSAFSITDTLILKGIAIAAIALHNYFHLLGPVKENEFEFDPARWSVFLVAMQDPRQAVQALFSFLGHYGVQIFIFVSAYGLARAHWNTGRPWAGFLWSRVKKIYPMFFLTLVAWAAYISLAGANPATVIGQWAGMLLMTMLGVQNLLPGVGLPPVGPWWFLPFIMQFYCIWPALARMVRRFGPGALLLLSIFSMVCLYSVNDLLVTRWAINLLETPIGHLPEICLGVFVARYGAAPGAAAGLIGLAVLVAGNMYSAVWPLSFAGALLGGLWLYRVLAPWLRGSALLRQLGVWSLALFLVNGFVRLPFVAIVREKPWFLELAFGVCSTALAIWIARLLHTVIDRHRLRQNLARHPAVPCAVGTAEPR